MISQMPRRSGYRKHDPKYMTIVEHLDELRRRLIVYSVDRSRLDGRVVSGSSCHPSDRRATAR
jgi:hypothetical protein